MSTVITPQEIFSKAKISSKVCLFCHPNPGMEMYQTKHFRLLRVNFPAMAGHIMISSKLHFGSLGELESEMLPELDELKKNVSNWFRENFGSVSFYEHGRAGSCLSKDPHGQQCEHFHLNCIPTTVCIHNHLKGRLEKYFCVNATQDICELFRKWGDYLYYENNLKDATYYPVLKSKIPPHFLRTLVCKELGTPEKADWQEHQDFADFLKSYNVTKPLEEYLNDLF